MKWFFVSTFALVWIAAATKPHDPRPNIIIILADDMGYSDIGCYGGEVHTPMRRGISIV